MCFRGARGCEADENVRKFAKKKFPRDAWNESRFLCCCEYNNFSFAQTLDFASLWGEEVGAMWQQFDIQNTPHTLYTGEKASGWGVFGGRREKFIKT